MKIRKGTFETNSSSTHSIAISKDKVNPYNLRVGYSINFSIGEYGWEEEEYSFPSYMYTALLCADDQESIEKLKSILNKWGVEYKFQEPKWYYYSDGSRTLDNGYIDHSCEAYPIIMTILNDEDLLARALFGDSCVYTGNDNSSEGYNMCWCAEETIWYYDKDYEVTEVKNPNHNPEKYDYFFKGN